uniref:Protein kinase domain-containing protein n=1 Tax=Chlamydomonas leiostraca TaxID=1034604 RepID=A0A7S0WYC6_9CHLO|mmetsp:Transcript_34631/g.87640  ORF Transcript_34631/g.87640 Transcript_34631/m.87640 type:complete len:378 (+) Transcript_34631:312-1445(+)
MPVPQPAVNPLANNPKYERIQDLSSGSFGFVQLARNKQTGEQVAIKFIERGDRVNKYVEAEILNHRALRHPHVVEFKEAFITPDFICIAMEYAAGGNLFNYVSKAVRLKEPAARWFFQQLVIGLDYCHRKGVVNRDIKLENTLLQMVPGLPLPLLKICDFGYSKEYFASAPRSKVGTLAYMAPEVIRSTGNYDGKLADIWSCGVMLYVMLFGQYPFENPAAPAAGAAAAAMPPQARVQLMMQRILGMQWAMPADVPISPECRDLLSRLLVAEPSRRLNMDQIAQHPWFLQNLPPDALTMNVNFLTNADYSMVQSEAEIKAILAQARVPGPSKHNFGAMEGQGDDFGDAIDEAIDNELEQRESLVAPHHHPQQQPHRR